MNQDMTQESVTSTQLEDIESHGFTTWDAFIDTPTVENLRTYYDRILRKEIVIPGDRMLGSKIRQVMAPHSAIDYFRDNPAVERAKAVARKVFNQDDVWLYFDMLISKEPGNLNETPWHQDYSYSQMPFAPEGTLIDNHSLNFWIGLDDIKEENGCMRFIPGVHEQPLLPHYIASGNPDDSGRLTATDAVDHDQSIPACFAAGGASVHFEGTPHYAGGNHTADLQRRAYIIVISSRPPEES